MRVTETSGCILSLDDEANTRLHIHKPQSYVEMLLDAADLLADNNNYDVDSIALLLREGLNLANVNYAIQIAETIVDEKTPKVRKRACAG